MVAVRREREDRPRAAALGVTGTPIYAGRIHDLDQNAEVRGELWIGSPSRIGIADKMIRDAIVKRSHDSVTGPIVGGFWDVEAASDDPLDIEVAEFVEHVLFERISWARFLEQAMSYLRYGVSLFEVTDDLAPISARRFPLHPGRGTGLVVTGLHHRPAPTIDQWIANPRDPSKLAAVTQYASHNDVEGANAPRISADRLLRFTWEQDGGNFRGYAPARAQYGAWKAKLLCLVLEMIKHERAHVPTPVLELGDDGGESGSLDLVDEAEQILMDLRSHEKGYAILPNGVKLSLETVQGTTDIHQTITRCDQQLLMVFACGYEHLGTQGTGSNALAGTQKSTQEITLDRHAALIQDVINIGSDGWSLIDRIVRANYGRGVASPRVCVRSLPTRDWSAVLPLVRNLGEIGFLTPGRKTEHFLRDVMTLPRESAPYVLEGTRAMINASAEPAKEPTK